MKTTSHLSRSAIDATRFTATSPHAYSKPTSSLRSAPVSSSTTAATSRTTPPQSRPRFTNPNAPRQQQTLRPPRGGGIERTETPAEKVARLRAARLAEKEGQTTRWEKVVIRGRSWADRAHKITVYSLVTFSVAAAAITAFALTDMILHNRRKRSAFYAEQRSLYASRLLDAIECEKQGLALDEDQTLILNRERARVQAEEMKKEGSWGRRVGGWLVGGLKEEEGRGEVAGVMGEGEGEVLERVGVGSLKVLEEAEGKVDNGDRKTSSPSDAEAEQEPTSTPTLLQQIERKRRAAEKSMEAQGVKGGPMDQMAEEAVREVKSKGSGWFGWGR